MDGWKLKYSYIFLFIQCNYNKAYNWCITISLHNKDVYVYSFFRPTVLCFVSKLFSILYYSFNCISPEKWQYIIHPGIPQNWRHTQETSWVWAKRVTARLHQEDTVFVNVCLILISCDLIHNMETVISVVSIKDLCNCRAGIFHTQYLHRYKGKAADDNKETGGIRKSPKPVHTSPHEPTTPVFKCRPP